MIRARIRVDGLRFKACEIAGAFGGADGVLTVSCGEGDGPDRNTARGARGLGLARVCGDVGLAGGSVADGRRQGWEWNGSQDRARARLNWVITQTPALWLECRVRRRAERVRRCGQGKDPSSEGLGGHDLLTQADAGCPAAPGCVPSPVPPARRRWRRSGRTACGSVRHRT